VAARRTVARSAMRFLSAGLACGTRKRQRRRMRRRRQQSQPKSAASGDWIAPPCWRCDRWKAISAICSCRRSLFIPSGCSLQFSRGRHHLQRWWSRSQPVHMSRHRRGAGLRLSARQRPQLGCNPVELSRAPGGARFSTRRVCHEFKAYWRRRQFLKPARVVRSVLPVVAMPIEGPSLRGLSIPEIRSKPGKILQGEPVAGIGSRWRNVAVSRSRSPLCRNARRFPYGQMPVSPDRTRRSCRSPVSCDLPRCHPPSP